MQLTFEGRAYDLRPGESVLDAMARHGVGLPSACRVGSCQACMIRSVSGAGRLGWLRRFIDE